MNNQPPEKRVDGDGYVLAVNSIFHTIQGEGPFAGRPAVFIRLAGCNLQCPLCDTEYTSQHPMRVGDITEAALNMLPNLQNKKGSPKPLVVITGGEPFRQPIEALICCLLIRGWQVQIETNGTLFRPGPWEDLRVTIVCSPKAGSVNAKLLGHIDAWKYVAKAGELHTDGLPIRALDHPNGGLLYRPPAHHSVPIYLQPADEQDEDQNQRNRDSVVQSCLLFGHRLCLQLHKIVNLA